MRLTTEQMEIVYSEYDNTYVNAKAGTGKTTTLTEFVRYRKKDKFLYLVYNNNMKLAAINRFPDNTEIHTSHSLAYKYIGEKYKNKLTNELKTQDIFNNHPFFHDKKIEDAQYFTLAYNIITLLKSYFNLSIKDIKDLNYPDEETLKLAEEYWELMQGPSEKYPITHDGYLKLYQLSKPVLKVDYIMVDEAQDCNEVMLDIVYSQDTKRVFVGDIDQKIYGFRGAVNVFEENKFFNPNANNGFFYLTESFRFGKNIADKVNVLLENFKLDKTFIKGTDKECYVGEVDTSMPYTIITRTNAYLFDVAYREVKKGKKLCILGDNFIFNEIRDGYYLYKKDKDKIKSDYIKKFEDFKHLKSTAKNARMAELNLLVKIIETYGDMVLNVIIAIEKALVAEKRADVVLTTAHKSKGLEFLDVVLEEDFIPLIDENGFLISPEQIDTEEVNIYYVAMTRAMNCLQLNKELKKVLGEE